MTRHRLRVEIDHDDIKHAMEHLGLTHGEAIVKCAEAINAIPPRGARDIRSLDSMLDNSIYLRWRGRGLPTVAELKERAR